MQPPIDKWPYHPPLMSTYREEASWALVHMVHYFGIEHVRLATNCISDALLAASHQWVICGNVSNKAESIMQLTSKFMIAAIRQKYSSPTSPILKKANALELEDAVLPTLPYHLNIELAELLFLFAHHSLTVQERSVLCLRVLCAFNNEHTANTLLITEKRAASIYASAIKKAKALGRPEIPIGLILEERLADVLEMTCLIFDQGYALTCSNELHNDELCSSAINLTTSLVLAPNTDTPEVHALLALMYFNNARRKARRTPEGDFLMLDQQDRTKWDKDSMNRGWHHFRKSNATKYASSYHLEAGIAAQHMVAKHFDETDWESVLGYYDALLQIKDTPDVFLNRLLVFGYLHGDKAALVELDREVDKYMDRDHLYFVVRSELQERCGMAGEAIKSLEQAVLLADNSSEKAIISQKLSKIKA